MLFRFANFRGEKHNTPLPIKGHVNGTVSTDRSHQKIKNMHKVAHTHRRCDKNYSSISDDRRVVRCEQKTPFLAALICLPATVVEWEGQFSLAHFTLSGDPEMELHLPVKLGWRGKVGGGDDCFSCYALCPKATSRLFPIKKSFSELCIIICGAGFIFKKY